MSALASSTTNGEPRYIECRLAGTASDTTMRAALLATVEGRALLGPAYLPVHVPETFKGERAVYRRGRWWIVRRRAKRAAGVVRG